MAPSSAASRISPWSAFHRRHCRRPRRRCCRVQPARSWCVGHRVPSAASLTELYFCCKKPLDDVQEWLCRVLVPMFVMCGWLHVLAALARVPRRAATACTPIVFTSPLCLIHEWCRSRHHHHHVLQHARVSRRDQVPRGRRKWFLTLFFGQKLLLSLCCAAPPLPPWERMWCPSRHVVCACDVSTGIAFVDRTAS